MSWRYFLPVEIIFGRKSLDELPRYVDRFEGNNILLVTGKSSMRKAGIVQRIKKLLDKNLILFEKIDTPPGPEAVEEGIRLAHEENVDLVIGLGGGSAIDSAKLIAMLAGNNLSFEEYFNGKEVSKKGIPLIAIPTTSGTGSEVSPFSVVWDFKSKQKKGASHEFQYPDIAILDPELTVSMPKIVTANTGMDALSQAIEAYWAKESQPVSDNYALKAVNLIMNNLERSYSNPKNIEHRENMQLGALLAGLAFSNTRTTAVHSVSYPLTLFFNITHGHACGLTLAQFLKYNQPVMKAKIKELYKAMGVSNLQQAMKKIESIMKNIRLQTKLSSLGIKEKDLQIIVDNGFTPERVYNNPRELTKEDLRKILQAIL